VSAIVSRSGASMEIPASIGPGGVMSVSLEPGDSVLGLQIGPDHGYFKAMVTQPENGSTIALAPLPMNGPLGWWHRSMGVSAYDPTLGAGVRVGVVDMGVGPNAALSHVVSVGSVLNLTLDPQGGADVGGHGSLVCGLIGARPRSPGGYAGLSPGAEIFSVRVYPSAGGTAQLSDVAAAIELLSTRYGCDLINLSLAAGMSSAVLQDAIVDAFEGGTLCIVAAGNQAGPVTVPASLAQTVAVTAMGQKGWAPEGSQDALMGPTPGALVVDGLFFGDRFSNRGPQVSCAGPGVGLISTVPDPAGQEVYGADTGTSLSCPVVAGALAGKLSRDGLYLAMPRGVARVRRALAMMLYGSRRLPMPVIQIGIGLPQLA
jgi:subtilisin